MVAFVAQRGSARAGVPGPRGLVVIVAGAILAAGLSGRTAAADWDWDGAEELLRTGRYDECAKLVAAEIAKGVRGEPWWLLKIEAELARGNDKAAMATLREALRRFPASVSLHLLARDVYRYNGRADEASAALDAIERMILAVPQRYASPEDRVALGRFFLRRGADARKVLDQFYDAALKQRPGLVEAHLASAELALDKQDFALAATTLQKAPKEAAEDPRYHYLLALAFSDDDRARSDEAIDAALKINPRHADSLLLRADHLIDAEKYDEAEKLLAQVIDVNLLDARAWAYRAVLAHLKNDRVGEASARTSALSRWAKDPQVDHLIGRKLSQKYRFAEGSAYQRRALELAPDDLPAKVQLCQDLLRLGDESEGWKLADEIFARDGYNVVAYNLITLRDRLSGFRTLQEGGFVVRMEAREADLYGRRVMDLLRRARGTLAAKYGATVPDPVIVEIFPQKKEFAVRTFGLPGAEGFLGVCFGRVVTANSPASQGEHPSNWEAVLWHEFCHVVTLSKTNNKMPRWLSEGISVYEEQEQDPSWGEALNPKFREMILGDGLTPLSRLSSAFLEAKTPLHVQFAYFESALAVDFLVHQAGLPALKDLLDDLGAGVPINEALPRRTKLSLEQLDRDFSRFARRKAEAVAPAATWEEPELPAEADSEAVAAWLEGHPKSFWGLRRLASRLVAEEKWDRAKETLKALKELYPEYVGAENAYAMLATVHRKTSDPAAEREALEAWAARDGSASPALLRLMELDEQARDWRGLARDARRMLAVNPLIPAPYRHLGRACEELGDRDEAIAAYRALAMLDDTDPAEVHYRLATLLKQGGRAAEARREVLRSLEEAPRFREAHRLLLDLVGPDPAESVPPTPKPADRKPNP
jgi:tetratricopeptide (TPR) repeat protein